MPEQSATSPADGLLSFTSRAEWRVWLGSHLASATEARVAIYKKAPLAGLLTLAEVQEEALCFGWVDGTAGSVDDIRYMIRLTPRRPNSEWSMSNVRRVERLAAEGLMTEAGWKTVDEAKRNGQWDLALRIEQTDILPPELEAALGVRRGLREAYLALSHSRRRMILRSLFNAKTEPTRNRRIAAVISEISAASE